MTRPGSMLDFISHRDHSLMRRVNRWRAPRWIRVWMLCATRGGDGWLWYGMALVILLFGGHLGVRADIRHFHSFQDLTIPVVGFTINGSKLNFGRASAGLVVKF